MAQSKVGGFVRNHKTGLPRRDKTRGGATKALPARVVFWTAVFASLIIIFVDPFFTDNPWWALSSLGSEAAEVVMIISFPFVGWFTHVWVLGVLLEKHTHRLAVWALALTAFWTAVVPGVATGLLLEDALYSEGESPVVRASIFFYIWHVPCVLSLVLWSAYVFKLWRERRTARAQQTTLITQPRQQTVVATSPDGQGQNPGGDHSALGVDRFVGDQSTGLPRRDQGGVGVTKNLPARVALWTATFASLIIVFVDPFFTGHRWWALASLGIQALDAVTVAGTPLVIWFGLAWLLGVLLKKHTHWLALWALALTVLWTAVVPGVETGVFVRDELYPDQEPPMGRLSIFSYIWYVPCLASIVLWAVYIIRLRRERRAAKAQAT